MQIYKFFTSIDCLASSLTTSNKTPEPLRPKPLILTGIVLPKRTHIV